MCGIGSDWVFPLRGPSWHQGTSATFFPSPLSTSWCQLSVGPHWQWSGDMKQSDDETHFSLNLDPTDTTWAGQSKHPLLLLGRRWRSTPHRAMQTLTWQGNQNFACFRQVGGGRIPSWLALLAPLGGEIEVPLSDVPVQGVREVKWWRTWGLKISSLLGPTEIVEVCVEGWIFFWCLVWVG